jgi:hypothetical protein
MNFTDSIHLYVADGQWSGSLFWEVGLFFFLCIMWQNAHVSLPYDRHLVVVVAIKVQYTAHH